MNRKLTATLTGMLLLAGLSACSTRPPIDEVWLFYMNGSIDKKEFSQCIDPNTKGPWQANNDTFALPTSLRTWNISPNGGDSNQATIVGSKPGADGQAGPQVAIWTTVEFYLNTNCTGGKDSPVVKFWEQTGRRYNLSGGDATFSSDAWNKIMLNTLVPVQTKAMQRVARPYSADEMDTNLASDDKLPAEQREVWKKMEAEMQAEFTEQLKLKVGGDYFCGVGYNRNSGECPPVRISITDISYADPNLQAKRAEVRAAAEEAKKKLIEAQSQTAVAAELAKSANSPQYLRLKELETQLQIAQACAAAPNCTMVVPNGTGINVNSGK
jgi:hypothetical protein